MNGAYFPMIFVAVIPQSDSRGPPSPILQKLHGWTARKKGAMNGEEKEAITEQCIQLELWPVH